MTPAVISAPFDASNWHLMISASSASALSIAATYLADSRLEGTEIKLSTLPTAGHNGVAGDPNAGLDRHKAAHAEFAGAGGGHPSSTCRVRHCWLANVDLTPALFRHNHIMPWIAIDDTDRLYDPRARPRGHGCAIN